jgi:hypothetical protein
MPTHILLAVVQVGHVAGFGQPCAAGTGAILYFVSGPDAGAGYRVAPGIPGLHGLNHNFLQVLASIRAHERPARPLTVEH